MCLFNFLIDLNVSVTIVSDPEGTLVNGSNNTFDYPILTSVSLLCMATTSDGSPVTVTSYSWTATNCYDHTGGINDPCFYGDGHTGKKHYRK